MDELQTQSRQLPQNIEDLSKFVLVGREKLNAVRAEIRAIEKVGLAKEVHEQKLAEAQDIADAVLDAEVKIGELTEQMNTKQGQRSDLEHSNNNVTKSKQLENIGLSKMQTSRYETLARHPETVQKAKEAARAEGRIVTRQDVLNRIAPPKTYQQTLNEVKRQAREEHDQYSTDKKDGIVSIESAQKDIINKQIIDNDVRSSISKAIHTVTSLNFLSSKEIEEMLSRMTGEERSSLQEGLQKAVKVLVHISNKIGG